MRGEFYARCWRRALAALFLLCLLVAPSLAASVQVKKQQARSEFENAERMREELNGLPQKERTRREYQRVADAYRRVYYTAPSSSKADASVVAVAELLAECGRAFNDEKSLRAAIAQYEFLRREYPGSKYRFDALLTIGQIYKEDLEEHDKARETFQEVIHRYPHLQQAADAREAIAEMDQQARARQQKPRPATTAPARAAESKPQEARPAEVPGTESKAVESKAAEAKGEEGAAHGSLPLVTGIRHWSTPDYTRVAIDLEQEVKYEAGRVPNPDRIFFDLHDTKLASTLAGKTFEVSDGFLRRVRVAQFQKGMVRVVLEVDDVSDYSVFLLPNPYRLIVDIHGRKANAPQTPLARAQQEEEKRTPTPAVATAKPEKSSASEAAPKSEKPAPRLEKVTPTFDAKLEKPATPTPSPNAGKATQPMTGAPVEKAGVEKSAASEKSPVEKGAQENPVTPPVSSAPAPLVAFGPRMADGSFVSHGGDVPPPAAVTPSVPAPAPSSATSAKAPEEKPAPRGEAQQQSTKAEVTNLKGTELKATDKPTSEPTVEVVAPRASEKKPALSARKGAPEVHQARPAANGERSLIRALGLKVGRIVIDAGHGGHDTGTIGPNGLLEKDLVLDVALRLGRMLEGKMGADVIYTRDDDTFIPLETRTAIANQKQADLFISVHANSSPDPQARGVETYYLNFNPSPDALEVAARENAVSEKSIHELSDLVKKITLKDKVEESREFASDVQRSLYSGLAGKGSTLKDRGVKKAPFIVLIGANMPSILAEISFVSNPQDEQKLQTPEYRQKIAESLYRGVARYINGLSGMKVARAGEGQ